MELKVKNCSGCGACAQACPKQAITMVPLVSDAVYPKIGEGCVDCGLCQKVCPVLNPLPTGGALPQAFGAVNLDPVRMESTSGGVFTALAEQILARGGAVFGAAMNRDNLAAHICVESVRELSRLRGAKYIQSNTGTTFIRAKELLEAGRPVLYSGTPCQIGGLKSFLGKDYPGLVCVDLICHGVPAPEVWRSYVNYREGKMKSPLTGVCFRNKERGWMEYSMVLTFWNGKRQRISMSDDPYLQAFFRDLSLRESCYDCAFRGYDRPADLTLGDFWGVHQLMPGMHDNKGVSLVLVHTEKGRKLLDVPCLQLRETDLAAAAEHNPAILHSPKVKPEHLEFMKAVHHHGFEAAAKGFVPKKPLHRRLRAALKGRIKRVLGK